MGLFRLLFSKYRCLVYTAFEIDKYFGVVNKLKEFGVSYQTDIKRDTNTNRGIGPKDNTQYDIYVKEQDVHKAQQAIHS